MSTEKCGHTTSGFGFTFVCDKPKGHKGWHGQQRDKLPEGITRTDASAAWTGIHASKDRPYEDGPDDD